MGRGSRRYLFGVGLVSESELISALKRRDDLAYERIVREYGPHMLAVAERLLGDAAEAEDCVQEAFLSVFRNLKTFEERSTLKTWLHRITVNAALARLRKRSHHPDESIDHLLPHFDAGGRRVDPSWHSVRGVEQLVAERQVREVVAEKINSLPESYRTVLMLRDVEGFDTREAAIALNTSEEAIKTRLHRARSALRTLLQPLWKDLRR